MADWADVYVSNHDDRLTLESKALFFVPEARLLLEPQGITANTLNARSTGLQADPQSPRPLAGKKALTKVMACKPVIYESVLGFINVVNAELQVRKKPERLTTKSIIACVFELPNLHEIARKRAITADMITRASQIPRRIVESAFAHGRVTYRHAEGIRNCLLNGADGSSAAGELAVTEFISTRVLTWGSASVGKVVKASGKNENEADMWVYNREDLGPAPQTGHPWALG